MIAAVHAYSGSKNVAWMNDILAPDMARNSMLERVCAGETVAVSRQKRLAIRGLKILSTEFPLTEL
jgi:hypothetical protein